MAKFIIDVFESEDMGDDDEKLSDCGQLIFSAKSKKHVSADLTCKLIAKLDESDDVEDWYFNQITICDQLVPVVNFINGDISTLKRLTKDEVKADIGRMRILGFGQVQHLGKWIAENLKAYH